MLSLTRTEGQRIIVTHESSGEKFTIEIRNIKAHHVRLGFYANKTFLIDREEIYKEKKAESRI